MLTTSGVMKAWKNPKKMQFVFQQKMEEICIGKD